MRGLYVKLFKINVIYLRFNQFQIDASIGVVVAADKVLPLYDPDRFEHFELPTVPALVFFAVETEVLVIDKHSVPACTYHVRREGIALYPNGFVVVIGYMEPVVFSEYRHLGL